MYKTPNRKLMRYLVISVGNKLFTPPTPEQIEISIFGPGYGESILLHLGNNTWFIVDSCLPHGKKEPAPLEYLKNLKIDCSTAVKQIIATHWHSDHIKGLSTLVKECTSAEFVCSNALNSKEFKALLSCFGAESFGKDLGLAEFKKVLKILSKRRKDGALNGTPVLAIKKRDLWPENLAKSSLPKCSISALTPSDSAVLAAKLDFSKLIPELKLPRGYLMTSTPNRSAIVLWVSIRDFEILLGSDLEEEGTSEWTGIIKSRQEGENKADFFKIPHHGSSTAHKTEIWSNLLKKEHLSVLTPWALGNKYLPTLDDIKRICSLSQNSLITAIPNKIKKIKREQIVEKEHKATTRNSRIKDSSYGHVRVRINPDFSKKIEFFGEACELKQYNFS